MHNEGNYKQGEKAVFRMGENNNKQTKKNWQRISKIYNGEEIVSSTSSAGKTGLLHIKKWN